MIRSTLAFFLSIAMFSLATPSFAAEESAPATAPSTAPSTQPLSAERRAAAAEKDVTQGALRVIGDQGQIVECPLTHTDVKADISGFIARVKVTQTFHNSQKEKIEAVYVFPLPHEAAVDDMTMVLGERKIVGLIKRRAEAREIYQQAIEAGQTAALLEQERPNIFTQSLGNIEPGQDIRIEISYVDVLKYDLGTYEFHFPMVVGPRYNPGAPIAMPRANPPELQGKVSEPSPDTTAVPDGSKINPPALMPDVRNGHDVSLSVKLDAGVPVRNLEVALHKATIDKPTPTQATVTLDPADSVPNKDFILRYNVVGKKPEMAVLGYTGEGKQAAGGAGAKGGAGYFMLMVQPKEDEKLLKSPPREIVFLADVSGSMRGAPIAKAMDCMQEMLALCREKDTFQLVKFASNAQQVFERPLAASKENIARAVDSVGAMEGAGGTEMLKGVQMAIDAPLDEKRVRIIVMLTDGFIGNEAQIIEYVGKHCGDQVRFWCVGIGSAPNMMLVDGVAKQGGGMGKKLDLKDNAGVLAQEIISRITRAQLANIKIDWGDLKVSETYPARIPELWAGRPVIVYGRYAGGGKPAAITISGSAEGEKVAWPLTVTLPAHEEGQGGHEVLAKVWARQKIESLMQQTYYAGSPEVEELVTNLALDYRLMSQYTSFVAVDAKEAGKTDSAKPAPPRRMLVPVPLPEGTRWEGFFGGGGEQNQIVADRLALPMMQLEATGMPASTQPVTFGALDKRIRPLQEISRRQEILRKQDAIVTKSYSMAARQSTLSGVGSGADSAQLNSGLIQQPVLQSRVRQYAEKMQVTNRETKAVYKSEDRLRMPYFDADEKSHRDISAFYPQARENSGAAMTSLRVAQAAEKGKDAPTARALATRACVLDMAAINLGAGRGDVSQVALAMLQRLHEQDVKAWAQQLPALEKKLDIVLCDLPLRDAISLLAKSAGVPSDVIGGSIDDAQSLLQTDDLRVHYLDLRNATAAEGLDWLLTPMQLTWRVEVGESKQPRVMIGSTRRMEGISPWVYDVAGIATPSAEEQKKLAATTQPAEGLSASLEQFVKVAREQLKIQEESMTWFAPGQVVIFATPEQHAAADKLFTQLADAKASFTGAAEELHKLTATRAAEHREPLAKLKAARHLHEVARAHDEYSWKLLASAAGGKLNPEALAELQIAWRDPASAELLKTPAAGLLYRSLWTIAETARHLPTAGRDAALTTLLELARKQCKDSGEAALAKLVEKPAEADIEGMIYLTLAGGQKDPRQSALATQMLAALAKMPADAAQPSHTLAAALLGDAKSINPAALQKLIASDNPGEEFTVLLGLACRRAGADTWNEFRAAAPQLLGGQPLPGAVVVLINQLETTNAKPEQVE